MMTASANILRQKFLEDSRRTISQARVLTMLLDKGRPEDLCLEELLMLLRGLRYSSMMFDLELISGLAVRMEDLLVLIRKNGLTREPESAWLIQECLEHAEKLVERSEDLTVRERNMHTRILSRLDQFLNRARWQAARKDVPVRPGFGFNPAEEALVQQAYNHLIPVYIGQAR
ncbi:MAG: hypothetical protein ACOYXB_13975 [Bacteroidota bacterium]